MKKSTEQMIKEKYGIEILVKEEFIKLKESVLMVTNLEGLDFKNTMILRNKIAQTISKITNVKLEVLDCLTIQNIEDMFNESRCYYDIQKTLIDLIKLYNSSKEVGAQLNYSVMSRTRYLEESEYWEFQEDNEEELEYYNSFKYIRDYGMFVYTCHIDIAI